MATGLGHVALLVAVLGLAATPSLAEPAASSRPLVLAATPWKAPESLQRAFAPLVRHLSQVIGRAIDFRIAKDYGEIQYAMGLHDLAVIAAGRDSGLADKVIDIGIFSPSAYVAARRDLPGLAYLATAQMDDGSGGAVPHYPALLVTLKSSPRRVLADFAKARLAFSSKASASGYRYPMAFLRRQGIDPAAYFSGLYFLGNHDSVYAALADGKVDLAAVAGRYAGGQAVAMPDMVARHGDVFRIVADVARVPQDAVAAAPHLEPTLAAAIKAALLAMEPGAPAFRLAQEAGINWIGFADQGDAFYDVVREVDAALGPGE